MASRVAVPGLSSGVHHVAASLSQMPQSDLWSKVGCPECQRWADHRATDQNCQLRKMPVMNTREGTSMTVQNKLWVGWGFVCCVTSAHLEPNTAIFCAHVLLFWTHISFWTHIFHISKFSVNFSSKWLFNNQKKLLSHPFFLTFSSC